MKKTKNKSIKNAVNNIGNNNGNKTVKKTDNVSEKIINIQQKKGFMQKPYLIYILAFALPIIIYMFMMKSGGFYPFGDKSVFIMDMNNGVMQQYYNIRRMLLGDNSIFFNWSKAMGGNFLGLYAFSLASPLTLITLFFSMEEFSKGVMAFLALGMGCSGLTFSIFANYMYEKYSKIKGNGNVINKLPLVFLSVSYALISYNMEFTVMPTWTMGVVMLPLVILSFEKVMDDKSAKSRIFAIVSLAILFFSNYYMAYMIGIYTVLYAVYRVICMVGEEKVSYIFKRVMAFTAYVVIAAGIVMPLMIPVAKDLLGGKLAGNAYTPDMETNFKFSDIWVRFTNGHYDSITNAGLPLIYCGYLALALAVIFLFMKNIKWREKIGILVIGGFIMYSFYNTKLDIAWHAFAYPTWFPYRYSYVLSFTILYMALRGLICVSDGFKSEWMASKLKALKGKSIYVTTAVSLVLVVFSSVDMAKNGSAIIEGLDKEFRYVSNDDYQEFVKKSKPAVDKINENDKDFYRVSQLYEYSKNDAMLLGYNGMTHYSGNYNKSVNNLTKALGHAQVHYWNSGVGATALTDSLFGVRYVLQDSAYECPYTLVSDENGVKTYKNENALSPVYSAALKDKAPVLTDGNVFNNNNIYMNAIMGDSEPYFVRINGNYTQSGTNYNASFTASDNNPVYIKLVTDNYSGGQLLVNGKKVGDIFGTDTQCIFYLGAFEPGQTVSVDIVSSVGYNMYDIEIYSLDMNRYNAAIGQLKEHEMKIEKHGHAGFEGTIEVAESGNILTSIPFDEGWTVKIDGKKVDIDSFEDTFLAVYGVTPGKHDISLSYVSPGFGTGVIIMIISLFIGFGLPVIVKRRKK